MNVSTCAKPNSSKSARKRPILTTRPPTLIARKKATYRSIITKLTSVSSDWDKIPLNPTIFVEYKFGLGNILHDEGPPAPLGKGEALDFLDERNPLPDSFEIKLLLAEEFFGKLEWALNGFFEQEIGGDRGREYGFAQSAMVPIILPRERLKVGAEMQLITFTDKGIRDMPSYRFVVGPTIAWKPSKNTRLDVSPLFGVTHDAPRASVFVVFSMLFGPGGESEQGEAPASARNR